MAVVVRPMVWSKEPYITEIEPLSDRDAPVLNALRDVLVQHDALDRFGMQLVHRHFPIAENESMVEYIDSDSRSLTLRAEPSTTDGKSIVTAWRFSADEAGAMPDLICRWECRWGPQSQHQGTTHISGLKVGSTPTDPAG